MDLHPDRLLVHGTLEREGPINNLHVSFDLLDDKQRATVLDLLKLNTRTILLLHNSDIVVVPGESSNNFINLLKPRKVTTFSRGEGKETKEMAEQAANLLRRLTDARKAASVVTAAAATS